MGRKQLTETQKRALQGLVVKEAKYETWACYVQSSGFVDGAKVSTYRALVKAGLARVSLERGTSQVAAGPFGSTVYGWRTHHHTTATFAITDAGLAVASSLQDA